MQPTVLLRAAAIAVAGLLVLAPATLADTCCANMPVEFHPAVARSGESARASGVRCLNADNTGPLALNLVGFWLSPGSQPAVSDPDTTPGAPAQVTMPDPETWPAFDQVDPSADGSGTAEFTVPDVRSRTYQLWWRCDNGGGPGSGVHYGTGSRLTVRGLPATSTTPRAVSNGADVPWSMPMLLLVVAGSAAASIGLRLRIVRGGKRPM